MVPGMEDPMANERIELAQDLFLEVEDQELPMGWACAFRLNDEHQDDLQHLATQAMVRIHDRRTR